MPLVAKKYDTKIVSNNFINALWALGYRTEDSWVAFIQMMCISGIFGSPIPKLVDYDQAIRLLNDPMLLLSNDAAQEASHLSVAAYLEAIDELGQKRWKELRGAGERQQSPGDHKLSEHLEYITSLLKRLGMVDEIFPEDDKFGKITAFLNLGAAQDTVEERTCYLKRLIDYQKVLYPLSESKVYLLGGNRKLWPETSLTTNSSKPLVNGEPLALQLVAERIYSKYLVGEVKDLDLIEIIKNAGIDRDIAIAGIAKIIQEKIVDRVFACMKNEVIRSRAEIVSEVEGKYNISWPTESDLQAKIAVLYGIYDAIVVMGEKNQGLDRPDTMSTAEKFADVFAAEHRNDLICVVSNQPFAKRQSLLFVKQLYSKVGNPLDTIVTAAGKNQGNDVVQLGVQEFLSYIHAATDIAKSGALEDYVNEELDHEFYVSIGGSTNSTDNTGTLENNVELGNESCVGGAADGADNV